MNSTEKNRVELCENREEGGCMKESEECKRGTLEREDRDVGEKEK